LKGAGEHHRVRRGQPQETPGETQVARQIGTERLEIPALITACGYWSCGWEDVARNPHPGQLAAQVLEGVMTVLPAQFIEREPDHDS
jgi:hypothetical protein